MSDYCNICETRRPEGGTNHLILGDNQWLEFCRKCGDTETVSNSQTGETLTIRELFDRTLADFRRNVTEHILKADEKEEKVPELSQDEIVEKVFEISNRADKKKDEADQRCKVEVSEARARCNDAHSVIDRWAEAEIRKIPGAVKK
jgi:hypothetical protein